MSMMQMLLATSSGGASSPLVVSTWTGNSSTQSINTGQDLSTKKGFVWIKRYASSTDGAIFDNTSDRGANKRVQPHTSQQLLTLNGSLTSFDSTGYSLGSSSKVNASGIATIGYSFVETPDVVDVVAYDGHPTGSPQNISHNLGVVPELMIIKSDDTRSWIVYHKDVGNGTAYRLDEASNGTGDNMFDNTTPTSSVFRVGVDSRTNQDGRPYVAYLFASKAGVCKIGSYTGNGSTNAINFGFQPAWVLIKRRTGSVDWVLVDSERGSDKFYRPNLVDAQTTQSGALTFTSTGMTLNNTNTFVNQFGVDHIYMAFAAS